MQASIVFHRLSTWPPDLAGPIGPRVGRRMRHVLVDILVSSGRDAFPAEEKERKNPSTPAEQRY